LGDDHRRFTLCGANGVFGGALGMVTAWPLWMYVGAVGGAVILGFVSLICVLFVSKFDIVGSVRRYRDSSEQRLETANCSASAASTKSI
jgi:hypothetical protein